jgi:hypothetical protein
MPVPPGSLPRTNMMKDTGPPPPPPPPAPLPHPTTEVQLREFLQLTDASNRVHKELSGGLEGMRQRLPPFFPSDVLTEIETNFGAIDLVHLYLPWYQAYLSEQDMNALLVFYRTDAGKHYASVQGTLLSGAQTALGADAQRIVQTALIKHKDEIEAAKKAYDSKSAPAPAGPGPAAPK